MFYFFFFALGLIIGSFLNVVVLRLEAGRSLDGRSQCPGCGTTIHWYDNVPVFSFFWLRRRCRSCQQPISWQYPLVELITGGLFAWFGTTAIGMGSHAEIAATLWLLFVVSLSMVIAVYDARNMEIPLIVLMTGIVAAVLYAGVATFLSPQPFMSVVAPWWGMLMGGGMAAAIFFLLVYISQETWMGMGDVWLAGFAGAVVGLPALLLLLTLSFCIGAVVGGGLMLLGKKGMKSQIPFAPFLVVGMFLTLVLQLAEPWWLTLFLFPVV